jgi:hypothetical protein
MPSLRVDRMRTQCDDSEVAACDVGRVGAVGWFGQRVSRNRASSSPSTTAWPKIWRYGVLPDSPNRSRLGGASTVWPLNCAPNSEGRGRDLAMTKPRKATGQAMKLHRGTRRRHQQNFWVRRKARYALRQRQLGWAGKSMTIQVLANGKAEE